MRRLLLAFMCVIAVVTLGRGSMVHAMDPDFASLVATGQALAACDHHQASCDSDKVAMHRHDLCHGHKIGIPPAGRTFVAASLQARGYTATSTVFTADARPGAPIRPPSA